MPISDKIREQLINSFRVELAEHVQTMTDGLLAIEQQRVSSESRPALLGNIFRAAHSLKGAARAVGVTTIEQLAHALEDVLDAIQQNTLELSPELFTSCYQTLDAIQAVQAAYAAGETTPPPVALIALARLDPFRPHRPSVSSVPGGMAETPDPENGSPLSERAAPALEPASGSTSETIRVSAAKLDSLMAQLSELLVTKIRAEQRLDQIRQAQDRTAAWQKEWLGVRAAYGRLTRKGHDIGLWFGPDRVARRSVDSLAARGEDERGAGPLRNAASLGKDLVRVLNYAGATQDHLHEMNALMNTLSREYANDTMHMSLVIDTLEQEIKRVRMLPLSTITGAFGRMVRDLAQTHHKEAVLEITGGEVELDKRVLEQIKDPLIHLLRNAVDHGIERPEQRAALGKPRMGAITLKAEQLGKEVVLTVADDGAGLDLEGIRQAMTRRGQPAAAALNKDDLVELIFNSGVSTSPIITDVSGRGVGLDVVRRNLEALRGRIDVDWTPGGGTRFVLTLPLTLTSSRSLLVKAAGELFAIPHNSIERIVQIEPQQISSLEGHDSIRYNGRSITLAHLGDVLELPRANKLEPAGRLIVLVLVAAERRVAFVVDELAGEQEMVIKGLGKQLSRVGGIAGATLLGNGAVVLILNVADVIKLAMRGPSGRRLTIEMASEATTAATQRARKRILIVDDSITTRTLEKNILEAAGYRVQLAIDGLEALSAIRSDELPDLIVSDIAMPRLDGFDLTRQIKSEARTARTPIILVTSLDSPADKARGIEAGADAYIIKSSFDQNNLLETIEQLI